MDTYDLTTQEGRDAFDAEYERRHPSSDPSIAQSDANGRPLIYPGPDGTQHYMGHPVTASRFGEWLAAHRDDDYRNAAAYEGERYSEAIRGARAMREAAFLIPLYHPVGRHAFNGERYFGIPEFWLERAPELFGV